MPSSSDALLEVRSLSVLYGGAPVLQDISLEVAPGEFSVLMGPNGSGKTTLLRTIAGFERADSGEILLDGRTITHLPAHRRGIGLLFQEPALFPRRTAWENATYGLEIARRPREEIERRVAELFDLLHLGGLEERVPEALSGGERQRVALARTLAPGPALVLLDEPFASVDPEIRSEMRGVFRGALRRYGVAAIHVTHDREEGLLLGDRVRILLDGRIARVGPPDEVSGSPGSAAVGRFLGYNIVREGGRTLAILPRDVLLDAGGPGAPAEVEASGSVGGESAVIARLDSGERIECRWRGGAPVPPVGSRTFVRWNRTVPLDG